MSTWEDECDVPGCGAAAYLVIAIGTIPLDDPDFPGLVEVKHVCKRHVAHFQVDPEAQVKFEAALQRRKRKP